MIDLLDAKTHLRIDHDDDDSYIEALILVAQEYITGIITDPVEGVPEVTETQRHAARLLIGHWYEHREAASEVSIVEVPFAVRLLIDFNRPAAGFI